jgi:hypothetical protein
LICMPMLNYLLQKTNFCKGTWLKKSVVPDMGPRYTHYFLRTICLHTKGLEKCHIIWLKYLWRYDISLVTSLAKSSMFNGNSDFLSHIFLKVKSKYLLIMV